MKIKISTEKCSKKEVLRNKGVWATVFTFHERYL